LQKRRNHTIRAMKKPLNYRARTEGVTDDRI